jgi:hypothetical protein
MNLLVGWFLGFVDGVVQFFHLFPFESSSKYGGATQPILKRITTDRHYPSGFVGSPLAMQFKKRDALHGLRHWRLQREL